MTPKNIAEFAIGGSLLIGKYPHIPIRFLLQRELRTALGITEDDEEALRARDESEKGDPFEPSEPADPYAVVYVKAAAVGLCWPNPDEIHGPECPTLRACRHDVVEYGAGVYDALIRMHAKTGNAKAVQADIREVGMKLIHGMVAEATGILTTEVAVEKSFTRAQEATGTNG